MRGVVKGGRLEGSGFGEDMVGVPGGEAKAEGVGDPGVEGLDCTMSG